MVRCGFTVFDGIHSAVSNLYGFIQSDKRGLQTKCGEKKHLLFFCCPVVVIIDSNSDVKPVEPVQTDNWKHAVLDKLIRHVLIRLLITVGI